MIRKPAAVGALALALIFGSAADVAIATTFGPNTLQSFRVWADETEGTAN